VEAAGHTSVLIVGQAVLHDIEGLRHPRGYQFGLLILLLEIPALVPDVADVKN
jgi:hypothetical protein